MGPGWRSIERLARAFLLFWIAVASAPTGFQGEARRSLSPSRMDEYKRFPSGKLGGTAHQRALLGQFVHRSHSPIARSGHCYSSRHRVEIYPS
jgi:hypothetical protein